MHLNGIARTEIRVIEPHRFLVNSVNNIHRHRVLRAACPKDASAATPAWLFVNAAAILYLISFFPAA
jgi:hypothetical protein